MLQKRILGGTQLPRPLYSGLGNACTLQKHNLFICFFGLDLGLAWRRFSHTSCVSWCRCKKQLPEADRELSGGAPEVLGAANSCPVAVRSCRELSGNCQVRCLGRLCLLRAALGCSKLVQAILCCNEIPLAALCCPWPLRPPPWACVGAWFSQHLGH